MRRSLASVLLFFILASVALACEVVSHANDFGTSSAVDSCGAGTLLCNGACIAEDSTNCGSCGAKCEATQVCSNGTCGSECSGGTTFCGGLCVDTKSDAKNCGRCGGPLDGGTCPFCTAGKCVSRCLTPAKNCNGACIDVTSDAKNCGDCGHSCGADVPFCLGGICGVSCGAEATCPSGCADLDRDPNHCGDCNTQCDGPAQGGEAVCVDRQCAVACDQGLTYCRSTSGGTGNPPECVDLTSDIENCGQCGHGCQGATEQCHQGTCISAG